MTKVISEVKVSEELGAFRGILEAAIKKDVFYIQEKYNYRPCTFFDSSMQKQKGRSVAEVNSPKKPQKRTIDHYDSIYSLLNPKKYDNGFPTQSGFYFFIANKDFGITIRNLFYEFIALQIENDEIVLRLLSTPKINEFKDEKLSLDTVLSIRKNEIFYVGQAKNIHSRYCQHMSEKLDKTSGLKLGMRLAIYESLDFYCQIIEDDCKYKKGVFESYIRNFYGTRFGK